MKLYLAPGACSLADHIALTEAGIEFETIRVDLQTRRTEHGDNFADINPKGYVPALAFDDGDILTENVAILDWIAAEKPRLAPEGRLGRSRNIEVLAFLATEIHRPFMRWMFSPAGAEKQAAKQSIIERLALTAGKLDGNYIFGDAFCTADAFLYVMVRWARELDFELSETLIKYAKRAEARPSVQKALLAEGLS